MEILLQILPIILYILLSILVVVLIILIVKAMNTLKKVDTTLDDVNEKMVKMDGVFNLVDRGADVLNVITNKAVATISSGIVSLFKHKKEEENDEDE